MHVLSIDIGGSAVKGAPVDLSTGKRLTEIAKHFAGHEPVGIGYLGIVGAAQHGGGSVQSLPDCPRKFLWLNSRISAGITVYPGFVPLVAF